MAAKTPVGRMSDKSSKELSEMFLRRVSTSEVAVSALDQEAGELRLYSVPPALGTRTYWACPPSSLGLPKSAPTGQRPVYPSRHTLMKGIRYEGCEGWS